MSLYIGDDTNGKALIHLTSSQHTSSALTSGALYEDTIIANGQLFTTFDYYAYDLSLHTWETSNYTVGTAYCATRHKFKIPWYSIPFLNTSQDISEVIAFYDSAIHPEFSLNSTVCSICSLDSTGFYVDGDWADISSPSGIVHFFKPAFNQVPSAGSILINSSEFLVGDTNIMNLNVGAINYNNSTPASLMTSLSNYAKKITIPVSGGNYLYLGVNNLNRPIADSLSLTADSLILKSGASHVFNSSIDYARVHYTTISNVISSSSSTSYVTTTFTTSSVFSSNFTGRLLLIPYLRIYDFADRVMVSRWNLLIPITGVYIPLHPYGDTLEIFIKVNTNGTIAVTVEPLDEVTFNYWDPSRGGYTEFYYEMYVI